jgi:small conductance mechanosensitive channel
MKELLQHFWSVDSSAILDLLKRLILAAIIGVAGNIVIKAAGKILRGRAKTRLKLDDTFASILRLVITYTVIIICLIMILDLFGINTNSLIAVLGAAGVAVGLALKDTLSNIASGIILLFLRSYRKGDFIEFGSTSGTVKEMDLFTTTLETADGIFISAPNSSIWGMPLKNYSRNGQRRMELVISISYTDSIDLAFQTLRDIIAAEPRFLANPAPQIMVQSVGDGAVKIVLRAWAAGNQYWDLYWDQMKNVKEKIEAAGLTIPLPQHHIHIAAEKQAAEKPAGEVNKEII